MQVQTSDRGWNCLSIYIAGGEGHGFTTRPEWGVFFDTYGDAIRGLNETSDALLQSDVPLEDWLTRYRAHSDQIRRVYLNASTLMERHILYFTDVPGRWTDQVAAPLLDYLFRYVTQMEDMECPYAVAGSLIGYYGPRGDEIALMKCRTVRAVCMSYLDPVHLARDIWDDCMAARIGYRRHFEELDTEARSMGLTIYDVLFELYDAALSLDRVPRCRILSGLIQYYQEAMDFTRRTAGGPQVYPFRPPPPPPPFDHYLAFAALSLSPAHCAPGQARLLLDAALRVQAEHDREALSAPHSSLGCALSVEMARRLCGQCSDQEAWQFLAAALVDEAGPRMPTHTAYSLYVAAETLSRDCPQPPEVYHRILESFLGYFSRLPFSSYLNHLSSSYIYRYIRLSLAKLEGRMDLLTALLRLTVFRQPQTAVHSIMVSKLSGAIMGAVLDRRPELLCGLLGTGTPEEVQAKGPGFMDFIQTGGLLHDIGKLLCPNIINTQYRKITPIGSRAVQFHPTTGAELLRCLPRFQAYLDIALGHHRTYDGKGGYPAQFDNTASPIRPFIDIISVCDSLDAATDQMGRNYAQAKDFDTVLEELRRGRGTRYSGALVDLLGEDERLRAQLLDLLDRGRSETYYEVHRMIRDQARPVDKPPAVWYSR